MKGGSSGGEGVQLPRHAEEPACGSFQVLPKGTAMLNSAAVFARATYVWMLPMLFKHYRQPIKLEDVPAIREDDSVASCLAAFRADQAKRDEAYSRKHNGAKRERGLAFDLVAFFLPQLGQQIVSQIRRARLTPGMGLALRLLPVSPFRRTSLPPQVRQGP
jgi:hypothetical protein